MFYRLSIWNKMRRKSPLSSQQMSDTVWSLLLPKETSSREKTVNVGIDKTKKWHSTVVQSFEGGSLSGIRLIIRGRLEPAFCWQQLLQQYAALNKSCLPQLHRKYCFDFIATSCCPAWNWPDWKIVEAKMNFQDALLRTQYCHSIFDRIIGNIVVYREIYWSSCIFRFFIFSWGKNRYTRLRIRNWPRSTYIFKS